MKSSDSIDYGSRRTHLSAELEKGRIEAFCITHLPNIHYLSGFTGSAGVLAHCGRRWAFFTDGRYKEQARHEIDRVPVIVAKGQPLAVAVEWIRCKGSKNVGLEADHISLNAGSGLLKQFAGRIRVRRTTGLVERLRAIKDDLEITRIRRAVDFGSSLLEPAVQAFRTGHTEVDVACEIEFRAKKSGATAMSFETIVAGGPRSALPHARASNVPIPRKGFVVMDFGVILAHYCSDMTRTVHVGRPSAADKDLYSAVLESQLAAIAAVKPGVEAGEVDQAARSVLRRARLSKYFTHSTGHGVGLEIHEAPRIARGIREPLRPGMVITIEPGAYIPGRGGVRIEDMVLVTDRGCEVLTKAPKELLIL